MKKDNPCRFLTGKPSSGPDNMAMDEAIFIARSENITDCPTFRLYSWEKPCVTIGYFQKSAGFEEHGLPVTRRPTGGLAVFHNNDLSYSFTAQHPEWPHVYSQQDSYRLIHSLIMSALNKLGHKASFYTDNGGPSKGDLCKKTFFSHDLHLNGSKIAGSSQRRRGKTLLQQGSIYFEDKPDFARFADAVAECSREVLGYDFVREETLKEAEYRVSREIFLSKYSSGSWNNKY